MAAATAYGTNFNSSGTPLNGLPYTGPFASKAHRFSETIPTTSLDDIDDFFAVLPVQCKRKVACILLVSSADLDSGAGALDMDWVIRTYAQDGTATDTVVENAGTAYASARTDQIIDGGATEVPASKDGYGILGLKIVAAASTPAEGAIVGTVILE